MTQIILPLAVAALALTFGVAAAPAQAGNPGAEGTAEPALIAPLPPQRQKLGYGRLTSNDVIGEHTDRWRTGSVSSSRAWGYRWDGAAPAALGDILELRLQGQVMTPENLGAVNPNDRPFAGALSVGLHSHAQFSGLDLTLGADLVVIGPQTGLDDFVGAVHDLLDAPQASNAVLAGQVGNQVRPTVVAEIGRSYDLGGQVYLRPFAEARAGDETLLRAGADVSFGRIGQGELLAREQVTGHRYRVIYASAPGTSFVLGGDLAYVEDSVYLPSGRGYALEDTRARLRAGLHWQGSRASLFYGLTYLSEEFSTQPEGQVTGSLRVKFRF